MRNLLLLTLLGLLAQTCCRVISSRSAESLGDDTRGPVEVEGISSRSEESLGDDKRGPVEVEGISSRSDESLDDDKRGPVEVEGISSRSDESLGDDSAENESGPDTKDSVERESHSEARDSDEIVRRKIKVMGSGTDDDSAENESGPDTKDSSQRESHSVERDSAENESGPDTKGPFLEEQKANSVVKRPKRSIREYYERHREYYYKTPYEKRREICESYYPCDYLADRIGFYSAYRQYFGDY